MATPRKSTSAKKAPKTTAKKTAPKDAKNEQLLWAGADWNFSTIDKAYQAIEEIAKDELGLDVYRNQIEVITSEQMLDAYSAIGLPLMYNHWSFGKHFARDEMMYRKGFQGLAYEIVINSNPCISYVMEDNTMTVQTLVMAHAAFGHNHFFKNNYLFQQWTDADGILDYLAFAKNYIAKCEERHGIDAVEDVLNAAHALMDQGVNRYQRRTKPNLMGEEINEEGFDRYEATEDFNALWTTLPEPKGKVKEDERTRSRKQRERLNRKQLGLPEENILYFIEKNAPKLKTWQREIIRIVRNIAQYFYPQRQTKMMNEGCACYVHYYIMNRLHEKGLIDDGVMLEFIDYHSRVVFQPDFDDRRYSSINPYALGFEMMMDIARICTEPTDEDREWFPEIAGNGDPHGTLREAWANYRDESFILQFLSPALMRKLGLFLLENDADKDHLLVQAIHDEKGYRKVRKALAKNHDVAYRDPDIQVVDVDLTGDRCLILQHVVYSGTLLDKDSTASVLDLVGKLWGYNVKLLSVDAGTGEILQEHNLEEEDSAKP